MAKVRTGLSELAFEAEGGDAEAQYRLGVLFLLGESVEQDLEAAYCWLSRAAERHNGACRLMREMTAYQAAGLRLAHRRWLGRLLERLWHRVVPAVSRP